MQPPHIKMPPQPSEIGPQSAPSDAQVFWQLEPVDVAPAPAPVEVKPAAIELPSAPVPLPPFALAVLAQLFAPVPLGLIAMSGELLQETAATAPKRSERATK